MNRKKIVRKKTAILVVSYGCSHERMRAKTIGISRIFDISCLDKPDNPPEVFRAEKDSDSRSERSNGRTFQAGDSTSGCSANSSAEWAGK